MSILVLGSVNIDLVVQAAHLPVAGETVLGGSFWQAAGGKGANQAVAAARSGRFPVVFIAAVGDDDFGQLALSCLRREEVDCEFVKTVPDCATGVALIMVDRAGENCISVASGANLHLLPDDVDAVSDDTFQSAKVSLSCLESPLPTVVRGLHRSRASGATTILDPAPANREILDPATLALVDVLTPNAHEASELTGLSVCDVASAEQAGRQLQDVGCRSVVVTLGPLGAVLIGESAKHVPAMRVTATDATAAGDAFNGALAVALSEGAAIESAVRLATVAAGLSVTRQGAQPSLPTRGEIDRRF